MFEVLRKTEDSLEQQIQLSESEKSVTVDVIITKRQNPFLFSK